MPIHRIWTRLPNTFIIWTLYYTPPFFRGAFERGSQLVLVSLFGLCGQNLVSLFHNLDSCSLQIFIAGLSGIKTGNSFDLNSLTAIRVRAGTKKLPPRRFPTVGIVQEFRQTTTQLPPQTSSPWRSVCPPYSIDSVNRPNTARGRPSKGVGQVWLGRILYK